MQQRSSTSVKVFYPKLKKEEVVQKIRNNLTALSEKLPIKKVILFGSYAKGNYTAASDIDLFILYKGEKKDDAYAISKKILAIPGLEPHAYSVAEYEEMKETIDRMTRDGIVIFPE